MYCCGVGEDVVLIFELGVKHISVVVEEIQICVQELNSWKKTVFIISYKTKTKGGGR